MNFDELYSDQLNEHHPDCPGGCGELADECRCKRPKTLVGVFYEEWHTFTYEHNFNHEF